MIEKSELEKVELANELLRPIASISTDDQIDVLRLALDAMLAKKQLDLKKERASQQHVKTWMIRSKTKLDTKYLVTFEDDVFTCTCPDFQFRGGPCKHIKKVKVQLAGENQKNKLLGVEP
jgi:predicted nucleic acid-binding Zn finger protein